VSSADQNVGHGWVFPRPDGAKVRCGGPAICHKCALDLARKQSREHLRPQRLEALLREAVKIIHGHARPTDKDWLSRARAELRRK
jgi:hypothetical protein